jgi:excisionase family DNA binding protein
MPAKPKPDARKPRVTHPRVMISVAEKMMLTIEETAGMMNMGRDKIYEFVGNAGIKTPCLHSIMNGRKRLIPRKEIDRLIDELLEKAS